VCNFDPGAHVNYASDFAFKIGRDKLVLEAC
jgi:hypothetical protein